MGFVLGLAEASWVEIGLVVIPLLITGMGILIIYKAKADIMETVNKNIAEELKPVIKAVEECEVDIKELRKDEIEPIKKDINDIKRDTDVMNATLNTLVLTLDKNHTEIKDILRERDRSYKENFLLLFEKLDNKQDKK